MKSLKSVINTNNIEAVRKTLNVGLLEIKETTVHNKNLVYQKYVDLVNWYNKFIGLEELKRYQKQVTELQEKLFQAQENRRKIGHELSEIRNRSHEIQDQLHKINRQNNINKFLDLLKEETEIMKKEQEISNNFNEQDRSERDIFTEFTQAINNAHEKQRAQLEYTKYFGIFISFLGSFLSFVYSSIKKEDLKDAVQKNMQIGFEPIRANMEKNFEDVETSFVKMQKILKMYEEILNAQNVANESNRWDQLKGDSQKQWEWVLGASQDGREQVLKSSEQGLKDSMVQQETSSKLLVKEEAFNEDLELKGTSEKASQGGSNQVLKVAEQKVPEQNREISSFPLKNAVVVTLVAVGALSMMCMGR